MATVERVMDFVPGTQLDGEQTDAPPFTVAIKVTSPIRLDQFAAEVADAAGVDEVPLMTDGDAATASEDPPAYIWTEADIPVDALVDTGEAHVPDPNWMSPDAATMPTIEEVRTKAAQRLMLTNEELHVAIWHLLTTD